MRIFILTLLFAIFNVLPPSCINALNVTVQPGGNIQAAIDRVSTAGVKGKVILVEGTYPCDTTLVLKNYVTIVGAGADETVLHFDAGDFTALKNKGEYSVLKDAGVESLRMEGETKGGERYAVSITALGNTLHRNITFRNVEITNLGMSHFKRCNSLIIEGCNFHDNFINPEDGGSLYFQNLYIRHCEGVTLQDCDLSGNPSSSCLHFVGGKNINVRRVTGSNSLVQDGINIQENPSEMIIDSCTFSGNYRIGIDVQAGEGITITNCTCTGNGKNYSCSGTYSMSNNNIFVDESLGWELNVLEDGEYYIQKATNSNLYMTNTNVNGSGGYPSFAAKRTVQNKLDTQVWIVEKDGPNYKITNKADNRSLKETAGYVISSYNAAWNTYRIYTAPDGRHAIQQDQNALGLSGDAYFWGISGSQLKQTVNTVADETLLQFHFVPVSESTGIANTPTNTSNGYEEKAYQGFYLINGAKGMVTQRRNIYIVNGKKYYSNGI